MCSGHLGDQAADIISYNALLNALGRGNLFGNVTVNNMYNIRSRVYELVHLPMLNVNISFLIYTLPKTNIAPENQCLEDVFPTEIRSF